MYLYFFKKTNTKYGNKKNLFDGVLQATLDGQSFRYSREDYKNMDDLVNHLFDHFKEGLSK